LPKKQAGTAVLFLNTKGELLIIKPNYKSGWLVPGGAADDDESPLRCATAQNYRSKPNCNRVCADFHIW